MRVVIDTNILLVSLSERSPYHLIFKSFLEKKYDLCVTTEILNEYAEIFDTHSSEGLSSFAMRAIEYASNVDLITRY